MTQPAYVDCYDLGTIDTDLFLELQDMFRSVRHDMGGIKLTPKVAEALYSRGLIKPESDVGGKPRADFWIPTAKTEARLTLEDAHGQTMIEPRNAYDARLVVIPPEWAEDPEPALGRSVWGRPH